MYLVLALLSAFFAGVVSILSKIGMKDIDSDVGTFLRTIVVLIFTWIMVFVSNQFDFSAFDWFNTLFLILSGLATGLSWIFYFKALQLGNANKVAPIDKSSIVLTILFAFLILNEAIGLNNILGVIFITLGTFLMIEKKDIKENENTNKSKRWIIYAILSAVFAALTSILGKIGVSDLPSNLATAIRTIVVLIFAFFIILGKRKLKEIKKVTFKDSIFFLQLSSDNPCSNRNRYPTCRQKPSDLTAHLRTLGRTKPPRHAVKLRGLPSAIPVRPHPALRFSGSRSW